MLNKSLFLTLSLTVLCSCSSLPARAQSRATASASATDQYFYGTRMKADGTAIANMVVKRTVDKVSGTMTELVTDCLYAAQSPQNPRRVTSYKVDFTVGADLAYTLEANVVDKDGNRIAPAFSGTGQVKNAEWTAWATKAIAPDNSWTLSSDDRLYSIAHGPARVGLSVKKKLYFGTQEIDMTEDFMEVSSARYQAILEAYNANASSPNLECEFE